MEFESKTPATSVSSVQQNIKGKQAGNSSNCAKPSTQRVKPVIINRDHSNFSAHTGPASSGEVTRAGSSGRLNEPQLANNSSRCDLLSSRKEPLAVGKKRKAVISDSESDEDGNKNRDDDATDLEDLAFDDDSEYGEPNLEIVTPNASSLKSTGKKSKKWQRLSPVKNSLHCHKIVSGSSSGNDINLETNRQTDPRQTDPICVTDSEED